MSADRENKTSTLDKVYISCLGMIGDEAIAKDSDYVIFVPWVPPVWVPPVWVPLVWVPLVCFPLVWVPLVWVPLVWLPLVWDGLHAPGLLLVWVPPV